MPEIVRFLIFGIPLAAFGVLIDRILLRRHKVALHSRLLKLWLRIEETTFPDLARQIANRVVTRLTTSERRWDRVRLTVLLVGLSWLFTSTAASIGTFMDGSPEPNPYTWLPIFPVYFVNAVFDALTIVVTFLVLDRIRKSSAVGVIALVVLNASAAVSIAILSLPLLVWSSNLAYSKNWPGSGDMLPRMLNVDSFGLELEGLFLPEIEKHLRENGPVPFKLVQENWSRTNSAGINTSAQRVEVSTQFVPGATPELIKAERDRYRAWLKSRQVQRVEFTSGQSFAQFYASNLREFLFSFGIWKARLEGSLSGGGPDWKTDIKSFSIGFGRWSFLMVAATTLIPTVSLAFIMGLFAGLKLTRDGIAAVVKLFIERTTEDDPAIAPEKFIPFTLLFTVLAAVLYLAKEFSLWIADLVT